MARAKSTNRAEARRRYRAEMAAAGVDADGNAIEVTAATANTRPKASTSQMTTPAGRLGMGAAFRQSIHPVDIRADLVALPWLATHTKALWLPLLLVIGSTVAVLATGGADIVSAFLFAYFVQTPAIGGVFLAGFLAPRASWLLGLIVGLASAIGYTIYILVTTSRTVPTPDPALVRDAIISAFALSPVMGMLFASGAAWYRRFLQLSNPNRGRRADPKKKPSTAKAAAKR